MKIRVCEVQAKRQSCGARRGTRTPTPFLASGPKPGASTNFAILARISANTAKPKLHSKDRNSTMLGGLEDLVGRFEGWQRTLLGY